MSSSAPAAGGGRGGGRGGAAAAAGGGAPAAARGAAPAAQLRAPPGAPGGFGGGAAPLGVFSYAGGPGGAFTAQEDPAFPPPDAVVFKTPQTLPAFNVTSVDASRRHIAESFQHTNQLNQYNKHQTSHHMRALGRQGGESLATLHSAHMKNLGDKAKEEENNTKIRKGLADFTNQQGTKRLKTGAVLAHTTAKNAHEIRTNTHVSAVEQGMDKVGVEITKTLASGMQAAAYVGEFMGSEEMIGLLKNQGFHVHRIEHARYVPHDTPAMQEFEKYEDAAQSRIMKIYLDSFSYEGIEARLVHEDGSMENIILRVGRIYPAKTSDDIPQGAFFFSAVVPNQTSKHHENLAAKSLRGETVTVGDLLESCQTHEDRVLGVRRRDPSNPAAKTDFSVVAQPPSRRTPLKLADYGPSITEIGRKTENRHCIVSPAEFEKNTYPGTRVYYVIECVSTPRVAAPVAAAGGAAAAGGGPVAVATPVLFDAHDTTSVFLNHVSYKEMAIRRHPFEEFLELLFCVGPEAFDRLAIKAIKKATQVDVAPYNFSPPSPPSPSRRKANGA